MMSIVSSLKRTFLYSKLKKALFTDEKDVLEIIKWKDIYDRFETIINDTEGAVDIIDGMVIKNTYFG